MSYWTLRRKAKVHVAQHLQRVNEQIELGDGIGDGRGGGSLSIAESLPGNVSHATTAHGFIYTVDKELKSATKTVPSQSEADTDDSDWSTDKDDEHNHSENVDDLPRPESDTESDSDSDADEGLAKQLAEWAVNCRIPHSSLSILLSILRVHHADLPKDPRTLLHTEKKYTVQTLAGGSYYHFGIASGILEKLASSSDAKLEEHITLQINIDGLPLFRSSNDSFWPILGMLDSPLIKEPFIIGLYHGGGQKPTSAIEFLSGFVKEMKELQENGILHNGRYYRIQLSAAICDAPARAFIKNVKGHSGYAGCDKCTQWGDYDGKIIFPETDAPLRTDVQFDEMEDREHHLGPNPLKVLNIGMVSQCPLDYMHLVCLGVMRRLLWLWTRGPLPRRIGSRCAECISGMLVNLAGFIPREFARKPRSLREVDRWKATEFRQLLLYTGPVVLLGNLCDAMYKNFLILHVAIFILVNPSLCKTLL